MLFRKFEESGLRELESAPCVFQKRDLIGVCHVDNLIIFEANQIAMNGFQKQSENVLKNKDLGKPTHFLGIELM